MALKDAIATVLNRNAFYRDGYRLLLRLSIIQSLVIVALAAVIDDRAAVLVELRLGRQAAPSLAARLQDRTPFDAEAQFGDQEIRKAPERVRAH